MINLLFRHVYTLADTMLGKINKKSQTSYSHTATKMIKNQFGQNYTLEW